MAMQKGALKVHELLFLTFQAFLPSEPSARVDGLNTVETPLKAARNFAEALTTLRTWRQQVVTVVTDLKANPEPLKLFNSLKILISQSHLIRQCLCYRGISDVYVNPDQDHLHR